MGRYIFDHVAAGTKYTSCQRILKLLIVIGTVWQLETILILILEKLLSKTQANSLSSRTIFFLKPTVACHVN